MDAVLTLLDDTDLDDCILGIIPPVRGWYCPLYCESSPGSGEEMNLEEAPTASSCSGPRIGCVLLLENLRVIGLGDAKRMVSLTLWIVDSKSGSPPGILFLEGPAVGTSAGISSSVMLVMTTPVLLIGVSATGVCISLGCDSSSC